MKIMILGDTGLIGRQLIRTLKNSHEILGLSRSSISTDHNHLVFDLEVDDLKPILQDFDPDIIISCTRGDFQAQLAVHQVMVDYSKDHNVRIHFYSTANVFDGLGHKVMYESDQPKPDSPYGKYKVEVEGLLDHTRDVIIRLPMVFGTKGPRMKQIQEAFFDGEPIDVFKGIELSMILDHQVANLHKQIIESGFKGICHFTSKDTIDMFQFYADLVGEDVLNVSAVDKQYFALASYRDFVQAEGILISDIKDFIGRKLTDFVEKSD